MPVFPQKNSFALFFSLKTLLDDVNEVRSGIVTVTWPKLGPRLKYLLLSTSSAKVGVLMQKRAEHWHCLGTW